MPCNIHHASSVHMQAALPQLWLLQSISRSGTEIKRSSWWSQMNVTALMHIHIMYHIKRTITRGEKEKMEEKKRTNSAIKVHNRTHTIQTKASAPSWYCYHIAIPQIRKVRTTRTTYWRQMGHSFICLPHITHVTMWPHSRKTQSTGESMHILQRISSWTTTHPGT